MGEGEVEGIVDGDAERAEARLTQAIELAVIQPQIDGDRQTEGQLEIVQGLAEIGARIEQAVGGAQLVLGGLVLVVGGIGVTVVLVVLFNLISDLTGGIRFTMIEEETAVRQRWMRRGDVLVDQAAGSGCRGGPSPPGGWVAGWVAGYRSGVCGDIAQSVRAHP